MAIIVSVLGSWFQAIGQFVRECTSFYYRLFTNKMGLPRWLWLLAMLSFAAFFAVVFIHDFFH